MYRRCPSAYIVSNASEDLPEPERPVKTTSLFLGIFTVFLPCGLLYGIILALAAFQDPFTGALGMLFFGLGTLPALALGTNIISKVFNPLKESWPNLTCLCLISFGLFTIVFRIFTAYEKINCH